MASDRGKNWRAPLPMERPPLDAIRRLLAKVIEAPNPNPDRCPDPCWLWQGHVYPKGYGRIKVSRKPQLVHRVAYAAFVAPIPEGMSVDHKCLVCGCINPDHLRLMTVGENASEGNDRRHNGTPLQDAPF